LYAITDEKRAKKYEEKYMDSAKQFCKKLMIPVSRHSAIKRIVAGLALFCIAFPAEGWHTYL
jgi:hypothetical protein